MKMFLLILRYSKRFFCLSLQNKSDKKFTFLKTIIIEKDIIKIRVGGRSLNLKYL